MLKRGHKDTRGFTLVEIMIVVVIIGILASLAVPAFQRARWKAVETSIRNNLRQIWGASQQYMMEQGIAKVDNFETIVKWTKKDGTAGAGTNAGYTGVIKAISDEDYGTLVCKYVNDTGAEADAAAKIIYDTAVSLRVTVTGGGGKTETVTLNI